MFFLYQALLIKPSEVQLQNSCCVLQVGCSDSHTHSLQYLNSSDNDNTISEISIILSLLWLLWKGPNITLNLYNTCLLCAASGGDTDNRLCLFVCVSFSQKTRATAVSCTAQPITSLRKAAGWMGRLYAKSAAASRVILLEIIWSGVSGSHRYCRLRGSSFCLVHKKSKIFSFFSNWSDLPEAMCIPNPFILLALL